MSRTNVQTRTVTIIQSNVHATGGIKLECITEEMDLRAIIRTVIVGSGYNYEMSPQ